MNTNFNIRMNKVRVSQKKMQVIARVIRNMKVKDVIHFLELQNNLSAKYYVNMFKNFLSNLTDNYDHDKFYVNYVVTSIGSKRIRIYKPKSRGRGYEVRKRGKSNILVNVIYK